MSDEEEEDKQTDGDLIALPPTLSPSQNQPVPGHFSLLKRQPQHSEAVITPGEVAVKTSASGTKSVKNGGQSSASSDVIDSSSRAGAGKGNRSHPKQDQRHSSKTSKNQNGPLFCQD